MQTHRHREAPAVKWLPLLSIPPLSLLLVLQHPDLERPLDPALAQDSMQDQDLVLALVHPALRLVHPALGLVHPVLGLVHPALGMVRPAPGLVRPAPGSVRPVEGSVNPVLGFVAPARALVVPGLGLVVPAQVLHQDLGARRGLWVKPGLPPRGEIRATGPP